MLVQTLKTSSDVPLPAIFPNAPLSHLPLPDRFAFVTSMEPTSAKEMALVLRTRRVWRSTIDTVDESKETPLIVLDSKGCTIYYDLQQQLATLTPHQREVFFSLSSGPEHLCSRTGRDVKYEAGVTKRPLCDDAHLHMEANKLNTFNANATFMSPRSQYAVFPLFSRINHDCTPNTYASYNPTLSANTVYATRDIKAGEELLISYINPAQRRSLRQAELSEGFDIYCECDSCTPSSASKASEGRRHTIQHARNGLARYDGVNTGFSDVVPTEPNLALNMAEKAIEFMSVEGLTNMSLAKLHRQAAKYALQLSRVEKARSHAQREAVVERVCLGLQTQYLNDRSIEEGGGNAAGWMDEIERMAEKDRVKINMNQKRVAKETKKAEKKAEKKAGKKGRK